MTAAATVTVDGQQPNDEILSNLNSSSSSSSSAASSASSLNTTEPSIISIPEAIYSAVPVSSELYIIPHSSKGFKWNEDLFMKPHQRRSLGVDEMYRSDGSSAPGGAAVAGAGAGASTSSSSSAITVHEIRLDEDESRQILPS
ncbi:hypothetical protein BGZ65_009887, partial [Modicella reniformis]